MQLRTTLKTKKVQTTERNHKHYSYSWALLTKSCSKCWSPVCYLFLSLEVTYAAARKELSHDSTTYSFWNPNLSYKHYYSEASNIYKDLNPYKKLYVRHRIMATKQFITSTSDQANATSHQSLNHRNLSKQILKLSSSTQIRMQLLLNLGVAACPKITVESPCQRRSTFTDNSFMEPLKHNTQFDCAQGTPTPTPSMTDIIAFSQLLPAMKNNRRTKSALTFDDLFHVLQILHHNAHSIQLQSGIWSEKFEVWQNVRCKTKHYWIDR